MTGPTGRPGCILYSPQGVSFDRLVPKSAELLKELEESAQERISTELIKDARERLEQEDFWGHSVSGTAFVETQTNTLRAIHLFDIIRFGLWPRMWIYGVSDKPEPEPYVGNFSRCMNLTAGDHFKGYAVAYIKTSMHYLKLVEFDSEILLIPPSELLFIVPSERVKHALTELVRHHHMIDQEKVREWMIQERIFSLNDIVDGKVTKEVYSRLLEQSRISL